MTRSNCKAAGALTAAALILAGCGGGGDKKEEAVSTTTAAAAETTTTTAAAETTTTTTAAPAAAPAASGQALKEGFSAVAGTTVEKLEDVPDKTYLNTTTGGWKATLDLSGDLDAAAEAFKAQITTNGYTMYPEDKGTNESDGHKYTYRSFVGVKEIASTKGVGGKRTTDRVGIDLIKSDTGSGRVTINVEHTKYSD